LIARVGGTRGKDKKEPLFGIIQTYAIQHRALKLDIFSTTTQDFKSASSATLVPAKK
jgi:hypothetical protein